MAMPIGGSPFRGIPPDKAFITPNITLHDIHSHQKHTTHNHYPHTFIYHEDEKLHTYQLIDTSIVTTTHPTLEALFHSLQRQLLHHVHDSKLVPVFPLTRMYSNHTHMTHDMGVNSILNNSDPTPNNTTKSIEHISTYSPKSVNLTQQDLDVTSEQINNALITNKSFPLLPICAKEPFFHHTTIKISMLTTRLLYPNTNLPSTLISPTFPIMPIFKNRLHRTNALRKLFEDVQITDLTYANAQILHQRVSSMALKPVLPGYHLDDAIELDDMKKDLLTIYAHLQDELKMDKNINPKDKEHKNKVFIGIVEIARSLLPDEMILDINFPVNSLLGLSHPEAISLLKNYYDAHGITKTQQFFKKRDTTFYLNEIFGILDFIHSENAKTLSPFDTQPSSPEHVPATLVTPLPPSPSKKRKTDEEPPKEEDIPNIDSDMEEESNNLLIDEMGLLTWNEVNTMTLESLQKYLTAYATIKTYPVSKSFLNADDLVDLRETLIIYIIELLHERSSSSIHSSTT